MRFVLDECLSQRVVPLLEEACHDVLHVVDSGLAGGVDDDVLEMARTDGRVLFSSDTDFGELLATAGADLPSLVLFGRATGHPSIKQRPCWGTSSRWPRIWTQVRSSCSPTTTSGSADCRSRADAAPDSRRSDPTRAFALP